VGLANYSHLNVVEDAVNLGTVKNPEALNEFMKFR